MTRDNGHVHFERRKGRPKRSRDMSVEDAHRYEAADKRIQDAVKQLIAVEFPQWDALEVLAAVAHACRQTFEAGAGSGEYFARFAKSGDTGTRGRGDTGKNTGPAGLGSRSAHVKEES